MRSAYGPIVKGDLTLDERSKAKERFPNQFLSLSWEIIDLDSKLRPESEDVL